MILSRNLLVTLREGELFVLEHALCTTDYEKTILEEKLITVNARCDSTSTQHKAAVDANSTIKMMAMKHSSPGFTEMCENNLRFDDEKSFFYNKSHSFVSTIKNLGNKKRSSSYTEKWPVVNLRCYSRSWPETRQINQFIQTLNDVDVSSSSTNLHVALTDEARARLNDDTVLLDPYRHSNYCSSFKTTVAYNDNRRRNSEKSYVSLQQRDEDNEEIIDRVGDQPGENIAALKTSVNNNYFSDACMNPNLCSDFASPDHIGSNDLTISDSVYGDNDDVEVLNNVTSEYCDAHERVDDKVKELAENSSTVNVFENFQYLSESVSDINYQYHDGNSHLTQSYDTDEQEVSSDIEDRSEELNRYAFNDLEKRSLMLVLQ